MYNGLGKASALDFGSLFFFFGGICECIRTTSFVAMRKGNRNASDFLGSFNGFTNF